MKFSPEFTLNKKDASPCVLVNTGLILPLSKKKQATLVYSALLFEALCFGVEVQLGVSAMNRESGQNTSCENWKISL